jgi:5'(3')-deoxyribonucleotidase
MQLFLDCDGVLADFERGAADVLRMAPRDFQRRHNLGKFWNRIAAAPDFFGRLPVMPDARELFEGVRHLNPVILTGCPRGGWAEAQKADWASRHFPGTPIITCMAIDKCEHCHAGDVLVDDTLKHRHLWEAAGGIFIHHQSARTTLKKLSKRLPGAFGATAR